MITDIPTIVSAVDAISGSHGGECEYALKMEVLISVNFYQAIRYNIPEDCNFHNLLLI
jgi:hypothetical protein